MPYAKCNDAEATHVKIDTKTPDVFNVTAGEVYKLYRSSVTGFEGEEMILNNDGHYIHSFSLVIVVDWLKEVQ